jgi:exopolysaccharide biosynthesis protein
MRVKRRYILITATLIIMSCIFYMGLFLSGYWRNHTTAAINPSGSANKPNTSVPNDTTGKTDKEADIGAAEIAFEEAVTYKRIETEIDGNSQVINLVEIDLSKGKAEVMPALSYGVIYGFEYLSDIVEREGAYAAVNGGFFSVYGEPSGLVMVGGELFTKSSGKYPVFFTNGNYAGFKYFCSELKVKVYHSGKKNTEEFNEYTIDGLNTSKAAGQAVLYTPVYGSSNRAETENLTYIIEKGKVTDIVKTKGETKIPKDGMLLTLYFPASESVNNETGVQTLFDDVIKRGDLITFEYSPDLGPNANAYECGCMILEGGKNIAGTYDAWIGTLTNRDPRTVIGIKDENTVVLMTVDGRQPGYSSGMTAWETAEFLKGLGVTDAAMLDGGASTEMIFDGDIVNRPSFNGEERKIAGAVVVKRR